jgi:hypothetical protein
MQQYTTSQVAKGLGISAQKLNKCLEALKIQTSYRYNDRVYWKLTNEYQGKGYDTYDGSYAEKVSRIKLLPTLHWTSLGKSFIEKAYNLYVFWKQELSGPFVSSLHRYTNSKGRKVVQLTRYDATEPLDGSRAYISEERRKSFCNYAADSLYRLTSPYGRPSFAIDDRDVNFYQKWSNYIADYHKYHVLLKEE